MEPIHAIVKIPEASTLLTHSGKSYECRSPRARHMRMFSLCLCLSCGEMSAMRSIHSVHSLAMPHRIVGDVHVGDEQGPDRLDRVEMRLEKYSKVQLRTSVDRIGKYAGRSGPVRGSPKKYHVRSVLSLPHDHGISPPGLGLCLISIIVFQCTDRRPAPPSSPRRGCLPLSWT